MRPDLIDAQGRVLRDLRISVTDRCNFRCVYCLPETDQAETLQKNRWNKIPAAPVAKSSPAPAQLSLDEIGRIARLAAGMGIQKIRLTGGEPLLRIGIEKLVAVIASIPGISDLAMTTNGFLFARKAEELRSAGLKRITFSLDSLDRQNFLSITGRDGLDAALEGISLAQRLGFGPVKVNAVVIRGMNDLEIEHLAEFAIQRSLSMRFIEFMPLDSKHSWEKERVVTGAEILERLRKRFELDLQTPLASSETARRWRIRGTEAEVGIIAPVTEPFCQQCDRLRLTADGQIRTCLFSIHEHDLRTPLRAGATDDELCDVMRHAVSRKEPGHRIGQVDFVQPARTMSCIGG